MRNQLIVVFLLVAGLVSPSWGSETEAETTESGRGLYLGSQRTWFFFSYLPEDDWGETLGIEFESYFDTKKYSVKNISYFERLDYPRPIPGQPPGAIFPELEVATGFNDLLTGFWISKKHEHHKTHHWAWGPAFQLPTASSDSIGSGKWAAGPTFDYEYDKGNWFAGIIVIQLWSFAGDADRKDFSYMMGKPFAVYSFNEKWDFLYMPYGIKIMWDKPSGEDVYFPVGGGIQRKLKKNRNFSFQVFNNVLRPTEGTEWDVRFMFEFVLN